MNRKSYPIIHHRYSDNNCSFFLSNTTTNEKGCMLWKGATDNNGYGRARVMIREDGKKRAVELKIHRYIAFTMLLNSDEDRDAQSHLNVLHKCDEPLCINPEHLYFGDQAQNIQDAIDRHRYGHMPISPDTVRAIRILNEAGWQQNRIAQLFNIDTNSTVSRIITGLTYEEVK